MKDNNYDFSSIEANIPKVKQLAKIATKDKKKPSVSLRPLKFEESENNTILKAEIIRRINEKNLIYNDLYEYCINLCGGDDDAGRKYAGNIISGLNRGHSMIDSTFYLLCDFLGLEIILRDRNELEEVDDEEFESEN